MSNFPGNPFANSNVAEMGDADAIRNAILVLAFEVRTANLIASARPVHTETHAEAKSTANLLTITASRLGLDGVTTARRP